MNEIARSKCCGEKLVSMFLDEYRCKNEIIICSKCGRNKDAINEKECGQCHAVKPIDQFSRLDRKYSRDGYSRICRVCDRSNSRQNYLKNLEANRAKRARWQDENHDEHLVHVRKYGASEKGKKARERYKNKRAAINQNMGVYDEWQAYKTDQERL